LKNFIEELLGGEFQIHQIPLDPIVGVCLKQLNQTCKGVLLKYKDGEVGELFVRQNHHENIIAPDHAFSGIIRKLWVVGKPKGGIKFHRRLRILYGEIDEYLFCHFVLC
jgi:hypothetical protein